jgi:hypothetical protein
MDSETQEEIRAKIASLEERARDAETVRDALIHAIIALARATELVDADFTAHFLLALEDQRNAYRYRGEPAYADTIAAIRKQLSL